MSAATPVTSKLLERLPPVRGTYREQADLSKINWFNVGGPAEVMFRPADAADLAFFMANKPLDVPVTVIGVGSNLLVRDGGIDGVVIRLGRGFASISYDGLDVYVGAGALNFNVVMACKQFGIAGLEFLVGIPGTIGGGLAMNAGCYGKDIAGILVEATVVDEAGVTHVLKPKDIGYVYRGNTLPEGMIFVSGVLRGEPGSQEEIEERIAAITAKREASQPVRSRTSGSTFVNPDGGMKAWELIDKAGCRGLVIGDAQVSEKHCNFLINRGNATAADIENLGEEVRRRVKEMFGVELHWEIKRIGKKL